VRNILLLFAAGLLGLGIWAQAAPPSMSEKPEPGSIAAGAMAGTVGALSGRYWIDKNNSLDFAVEFMDHPWSVFFADYYYGFSGGLFASQSKFWKATHLYAGIGAGAGFWDRKDHCGRWHCTWTPGATGTGNGFFLRAVIGFEWFPGKKRYSVYSELAPSVLWFPEGGRTVDTSVGARFYF
jgi:hypothetical protein